MKVQVSISHDQAEDAGINELVFAEWVMYHDDLTPEAIGHIRQSWREGDLTLLLHESAMKDILYRLVF